MEPPATRRPRIALVLDPRFPGGTSAAVAAEIRALHAVADLRVVGVETAMFSGRRVNPGLVRALDDHGIELAWNPPVIRSDIVAFHNPSCLKFNETLNLRISCRRAYVVTQENFLRPNGTEGFDVAKTLRLLDGALVCGARFLAPVSPYNRRGVETWLRRMGGDWPVADFDWFHICDFERRPPAGAPRDRRGRHSRAGFEKFPPMETMLAHFPPHAERCAILGGDTFLLDPTNLPGHWTVLRFGEVDVARFLEGIDFFVYFTHPLWRESFGRVIAEAVAAGKVVITDPGTAECFGHAVVSSEGADVDDIVRGFIAEPRSYQEFVLAGQNFLDGLGPEAFAAHILGRIEAGEEAARAAV
jgi:hypothetical protein